MGRQYISTVSATDAHSSDILGLALTSKYTITVSSDGYANFWDNKKDEVHNPNDHVSRHLINKIGIHHVKVYENILPDSKVKLALLAFASFDGTISFKYYVDDNILTLTDLNVDDFTSPNYWCPCFYKDPESVQDYFVVTQPSGQSVVYYLNFKVVDSNVSISFEKHGALKSTSSSFPNSIATTSTTDKKVAVGYTSGDVQMFDLETLKPLYTFHSTDLQASINSSSSVTRALEFSPGGSVIAVARDNQSSGSITLYDVKYGENIGSLTVPTHSSKVATGGFAHEGWIMGLSFNEDGSLLASGGFDKCIRIWDMATREREATIQIATSDLADNESHELDNSVVSGVKFIKKGDRAGAGGETNDGLAVISFDRGIRWFREAGGI